MQRIDEFVAGALLALCAVAGVVLAALIVWMSK